MKYREAVRYAEDRIDAVVDAALSAQADILATRGDTPDAIRAALLDYARTLREWRESSLSKIRVGLLAECFPEFGGHVSDARH